jgi:predicted O-methyltransferase YrrM
VNQKIFQVKSFINYWLDAVDEHSLHSPFFYNFYTCVVRKKSIQLELTSLKHVRKNFENDDRSINVNDLGAGSQYQKGSLRQIRQIARTSATPEKYSILYANIIQHFSYKNILELGTSLGINTLYLSRASDTTNVITFEGSSEIANVARNLFDAAKAINIKIIEGNIDETLSQYLSSSKQIDFALMDANHRYEPTLRYFDCLIKKIHDNSIIVLDDIHYSPEMEDAWEAIQKHELVYATADLFRCGLVFFNPSLNKQNVVLQF